MIITSWSSSAPPVVKSFAPPVLWSRVPSVDDHAHGNANDSDVTISLIAINNYMIFV